MNLNDIRKNAYLNINNAENQPDENDIVFEEKKDQIILSKNVQNNTVKKFTFQSISKVVDEIQNQKNQNSIQSSNQNQFGGQNQLNQNEKNKTPNIRKFSFEKITTKNELGKIVSKDEVNNQFNQKDIEKNQNNFKSESQSGKNTVNQSIQQQQILYKVPKSEQKEDSIYRRVAKFLIIIGEDEAAKVLPHLAEEQIEKIIPEIASIKSVSPEESKKILEDFKGLIKQSRQSGGVETARDILQKVYGKEKAQEVLDRAMPFSEGKPFEYLNDADSERVYLLLKEESVGVQTIVLSHLVPKKAAQIINLMKEGEKKEVMIRLAKMEKISPDVIKRIDKSLHQKSLKQTSEKAESIDGKNVLAQILKKMDPKSESEIINVLSEDNPDLGEDLRSRLFTIEDVVNADDRFIQEKLRDMSIDEICYLIAGKSVEFREKILSNVSKGRKAEILEQESILSPMRKSDCERITSIFFSILRRSFDEGHLIIKGRNDDVYV
ncbi:MAG: flagellar motor switch protein FliG [Spirochaetaceae bacterium]|nr:flagellar motor switch protein FliG [Spirochaetaceae bacterium]